MARIVTFTSLIDGSTASVELGDRYKIDKTLNTFGSVITISLSHTPEENPTDTDIVNAYKKAINMSKLGNIKVEFTINDMLFISDEVYSVNFAVTDGGKFFISDSPGQVHIIETFRMNIVES